MYEFVQEPVVNMRAKPYHLSEVVSQTYFGEPIMVIEIDGEWLHIATTSDGYNGWVTAKSVVSRKDPYPSTPKATTVFVDRLAAHLYGEPDTIYGPKMTLPFEACLELIQHLEPSEGRWLHVALPDGSEGYIQKGDISFQRPLYTMQGICELSLRFLGLGYLWGGRTSLGYDCSGFVQMLYRMMGVYLPRDAKDQINCDLLKEVEIDSMMPGDLIFFGYSRDKIRHVGMHLKEGTFIHAVASTENAPYIRLSRVTDPAWNGSGLYPYAAARRMKRKDEG